MRLGRFGIWALYGRRIGAGEAAEAARLVEALGFTTFWLGDSPRPSDLRPMLEATERLVVATGIVNIWQYEPADLAAEHAALTRDFPGRVLLGIGIGHPEVTSDYRRPVTSMRRFLDGLDTATSPVPVHERCVAALGPKMLDLSGLRSLGTHTYFTPVASTAFARERLGPGRLVAPELACIVDDDPPRARAAASRYAKLYLGLANYRTNLLRCGFAEEDLDDGGSDRLLDAVVPHGSPATIAAMAGAHLESGADHVCLQVAGVRGIPAAEWTALAQALGIA